jgi:CheY-like chemotaxis protein
MANILMIDDGALVTSWLSELLRREDHAVELANDESEALELYNEHLIVGDLRMPEGLEMVGELLRRMPNARILAIVSGEVLQSDSILTKANAFGNIRVLRKPFSIDTFLKTVNGQINDD